MKEDHQESCPYCANYVQVISDDHIFPAFLGGKRTIRCCKPCNDRFGHTFEAGAASFLQQLHVFVCSWGLTLKKDAFWREAYTHEGISLDLSASEGGVAMRPSKPQVKPLPDGSWFMDGFGSLEEAEQAARRRVKRGKIRDFEVGQTPLPKTLPGLTVTLEIGPHIRRLAIKMCMGLSALLPEFHVDDMTEARPILYDPSIDPNNTMDDYEIYTAIDSSRPPLSHLIYVERNAGRVYGVVQFFGAIQIFCRLGETKHRSGDSALLAFLDPLSGAEEFHVRPVLSLVEPPVAGFLRDPRLILRWLEKFRVEAIARGATHPPETTSVKIEVTPNRTD